MNKYFSAVILLFFCIQTNAQITLGSSDFPSAGDTIRMSTGLAFTGMDETLTGANYTWDYSQLQYLSQTVDTFLDVSSTNPLYSVIFANVSFNQYRANQATRGINFSLGTNINVSDVFNFFYNGSSEYRQPGFGAVVNGIPIPITYGPLDILYHFPLNFGDGDTSNSAYTIDLTSTLGLYYSVQRERVNEVDGWGSLTTPFGTFNALRVKTTINERDSVFVDSLGIGFGFAVPERYEYKWLGSGQKLPLLQIDASQVGVSQIRYRDMYRSPLAVTEVANEIYAEVYPNPAHDVFAVKLNSSKDQELNFNLCDMNGRTVLSEIKNAAAGFNLFSFQCNQLSSGNYLLKIAGDKEVVLNVVVK